MSPLEGLTGIQTTSEVTFDLRSVASITLHIQAHIAYIALHATTASKQHWRSNLISDLKSLTSITYVTKVAVGCSTVSLYRSHSVARFSPTIELPALLQLPLL